MNKISVQLQSTVFLFSSTKSIISTQWVQFSMPITKRPIVHARIRKTRGYPQFRLMVCVLQTTENLAVREREREADTNWALVHVHYCGQIDPNNTMVNSLRYNNALHVCMYQSHAQLCNTYTTKSISLLCSVTLANFWVGNIIERQQARHAKTSKLQWPSISGYIICIYPIRVNSSAYTRFVRAQFDNDTYV